MPLSVYISFVGLWKRTASLRNDDDYEKVPPQPLLPSSNFRIITDNHLSSGRVQETRAERMEKMLRRRRLFFFRGISGCLLPADIRGARRRGPPRAVRDGRDAGGVGGRGRPVLIAR